jgi:hypothetical protein
MEMGKQKLLLLMVFIQCTASMDAPPLQDGPSGIRFPLRHHTARRRSDTIPLGSITSVGQPEAYSIAVGVGTPPQTASLVLV